ncbi:MAG: hypothetical protein HRS57_02715 [Mycoplasmataceae bacterium]|nr:hypothetical protein [Mycoplasmataceae bacterium]
MSNKLSALNIINDYSEKDDYSHTTDEYIWSKLEKRIKGSSITIVCLNEDAIKNKLQEGRDFHNSGWMYKEVSASLRDWKNNRINGLIILYTPSNLPIGEGIPIYSPRILNENYGYIVSASYNDFLSNPKLYLDKAFENRKKQIESNYFDIKYDMHN